MELAPFRAAMAADLRMVMSGHFAVPALTGSRGLPSTLARRVMHDLLRDELVGITITITATSREQLDELYRTLSTHPMVKVVL